MQKSLTPPLPYTHSAVLGSAAALGRCVPASESRGGGVGWEGGDLLVRHGFKKGDGEPDIRGNSGKVGQYFQVRGHGHM